MSQSISPECWENNMRLYREMTKGAVSKAQQDSEQPRPTRSTHNMSQSPQRSTHSLRPGSRRAVHEEVTIAPPHQPPTFIDLTQQPQHQLSNHTRSAPGAPRTRHNSPRASPLTTPIPPLRQPPSPTRPHQLLGLATPETHAVACSCGRRSQGTCIHHQLSFDRSPLPDGLVCDARRHADGATPVPERWVGGKRKCAFHQDQDQDQDQDERKRRGQRREKASPCSQLEDFSATGRPRRSYEEVLLRSRSENWERVGGRGTARREGTEARSVVRPVAEPRGVAAALHGTALGSGVPGAGPAMRRSGIEPLAEMARPEVGCVRVLPSAWLANAPGGALASEQEEDWTSFDPGQPREKWECDFFGADPSGIQHDDSGGVGGMRRSGGGMEVGELGRCVQEEVGGMRDEVVGADLRSIENGTPYELDLEKFLGRADRCG